MKNLILVAVILQLLIIIMSSNAGSKNSKHSVTLNIPHNYTFGDILVFPRKCRREGGKPRYSHYAVYVGPQSEVDVGQGENNDIVHRIRTDNASCRFDQLAKVRGDYAEKVYNYLDDVQKDDHETFRAGTREEIKARIPELVANCTRYKLFCNNCEHFATKVRYNISLTMQLGAFTENLVVLRPEARALLNRIRNSTEEVRCLKINLTSNSI